MSDSTKTNLIRILSVTLAVLLVAGIATGTAKESRLKATEDGFEGSVVEESADFLLDDGWYEEPAWDGGWDDGSGVDDDTFWNEFFWNETSWDDESDWDDDWYEEPVYEEPVSEESGTDAFTAGQQVTLTHTTKIRSSMSTDSSVVKTVYSGDKVTVVQSYAEGWTKVTSGSKEGYIRNDVLN